jgi:hypothetical protein
MTNSNEQPRDYPATEISIEDQLRAARRELKLRERFYPGWIAQGRLTSATADHELAAMRAIVGTLEQLARDQFKLD